MWPDQESNLGPTTLESEVLPTVLWRSQVRYPVQPHSFLLPLIQEGQLSVTGESMCSKYWLTAQEV